MIMKTPLALISDDFKQGLIEYRDVNVNRQLENKTATSKVFIVQRWSLRILIGPTLNRKPSRACVYNTFSSIFKTGK
jgi:hypothetical protein